MAVDFDVAIVGAGPAGSATAITLARQGYRVGLIDKATFPRDKACAEYMSPAIEGILKRLGVLEQVEAARPAHLRGFDLFSPAGRTFRADFAGVTGPDGKPYHEYGLALPRYIFDHVLIERARSLGVTVLEGTRLQDFQVEHPGPRTVSVSATVQTAHPARKARQGTGSAAVPHIFGPGGDEAENPAGASTQTLRARLLVAADGVHSLIARRLGVQRPSARQRKIALVTHMRGIRGLGLYGEMHVGRGRYVGLAPLEPPEVGDLCNVAIVVDEGEAPRLAGRVEAFFDEALTGFAALASRLGEAQRTKSILAISRLAVSAQHFSADGVMLVGDATGFYDPFTGEGIYRALRGAELLAGVAGAALAVGDCSAERLSAYDRVQRREFAGKRLVEHLVQELIARPWLCEYMAGRFAHRKPLADTIMGVTGDFLPPSRVLSPVFMARLLL
ncbi:MAG TPA: NAD(P)/FAD-dependent oxidoreductase [Ktedonobacterales bacterium]|nr:NAD(P)/FAD-dependent oxidoreductase [Ktedonobacterales bacterium]